jgi:hypothetical protein
MKTCENCGSSLAEEVRFCTGCGTAVPSKVLAGAAPGQIVEVQTQPRPLWYVTFASGQRGGPFDEQHVKGMIARQEIKITDSVITDGGTTWVPVTQSPFARFIVSQAGIDRLAASTCPRCGAAMFVTRKVPVLAFVFIAIGIFTAIFIVGVIFLVIGWTMRAKAPYVYQCPRCKYRSA